MDVPRRRLPTAARLPWRRAALAAGAALAGAWGLSGTADAGRGSEDGPDSGAEGPVFTARGALVRPEGVERWILVGASLGMGYAPAADARTETEGEGPTGEGETATASGPLPDVLAAARGRASEHFHNVHLDPASFDHYAETGEFREGAMLAMVVHPAERGAAPSRRGLVEGDRVGLELAVKDSRRFDGGWAYFDFTGGGGSLRPAARPFPPAACAACHAAHAAKDNVFVQFYPVLRALDAGRLKAVAVAREVRR
ncbi:MAG TPA: cytochrome P460 family protein [Gemmatimonadota bacterium]